MTQNFDELLRRLQNSGPDQPAEVVSAFAGAVGRNIDRFLLWALQNERFSLETFLNTNERMAGIEEFLMQLKNVQENTKRVYESRLRLYAHRARYFLPLLPRTSEFLRPNLRFSELVLEQLKPEHEALTVEPVTKRHALVFKTLGGSLTLYDISHESDRNWFSARRSRFAPAFRSAAKSELAERLEQTAKALLFLRQHEEDLGTLMKKAGGIPEVIAVQADSTEALFQLLNEAAIDLRMQVKLLARGD